MDNITGDSGGNPALHDYGNIDIRVKATSVDPAGNPEIGDCGAMDKCCRNCGFWGVDQFPSDEGVRLPDFGDGFAICGGAKWVQVPTTEWPDEAMSVIDGDGYSADLITRKDHYCSAWEPEEQTINIKERVRNMAKVSASMEEFCVGKIGKEHPDG